MLYAVGKPVYLKASGDKFGAWMKDPSPFNDIESEKFWVTRENITDKLFEFANKDDFRKNVNEKIYRLDRKFHVRNASYSVWIKASELTNSLIFHSGQCTHGLQRLVLLPRTRQTQRNPVHAPVGEKD